MTFAELANTFQQIEDTSSRLEITKLFADALSMASAEEIGQVCYLALGRLTPKFDPLEFHIADKMMQQAIARAYSVPLSEVQEAFKREGDLGLVAASFETQKQTSSLSVEEVYQRLFDIASFSGTGSQEKKIAGISDLLNHLDGMSAKYVVRIPLGKLRIGFSDVTILDSLSWMLVGDKSLRKDIERAYNVSADIGNIATIAKKEGVEGFAQVRIEAGTPIRTAQAERLPSPEAIVEKLGEFAVEAKYDGFRVQVHLDKTREHPSSQDASDGMQTDMFTDPSSETDRGPYVQIFSRNLENMTHMFPDVVKAVQQLPVEKAIFDGEAIAYNPVTDEFLSFQETVQRRRKHGIAEKQTSIPLRIFVYDLLFHNGDDLLETPFSERRSLLEGIMAKNVHEDIILTDQEIVTETEDVLRLFNLYVSEGLEGIMCKKLDSIYQAGARNFNWIKYKRIESGDLEDTIDAVVMGYYVGQGKRGGFGIGAFLVGVADEPKVQNEKPISNRDPSATSSQGSDSAQDDTRFAYVTIAKIGTGVTDEEWVSLKNLFDEVASDEMPQDYVVDKELHCDVWVKPNVVVEIRADEITMSPRHSAGYALRFPRLVDLHDDKGPDDATTLEEIEHLFLLQPMHGNR